MEMLYSVLKEQANKTQHNSCCSLCYFETQEPKSSITVGLSVCFCGLDNCDAQGAAFQLWDNC